MAADAVGSSDFRYARRISLLYGAWAIVVGTQMPYLPVWFEARGLSIGEIATVASTPLIFRLVSMPVVSFLADSRGAHRGILIAAAWLGLALVLLLSQTHGFWQILVAYVLFTTSFSVILPLTETVASMAARRGVLDYGRVRLWASVTFIFASFLGGMLVTRVGPDGALMLMAAGAVLTVLAAHGLPNVALDSSGGRPRRPLRLADALALARHPVFIVFLVAAAGVQSSHAALYTFGTLHWQKLGLSTTMVGALWAVSIIAEIGLFAASATVARFVGPVGLLLAGAIAGVVRFGVMAFDPPLALLIPLQALHALSYAASHLGAMQFLARAVSEHSSGTGQALYSTISGALAMAFAVQLAGAVYVAHSGFAYAAMACLAALSIAAGLLLMARWSGGTLQTVVPESAC